MLDVTYILPNGEPAARVVILYPTVNVQTLDVVISAAAYDATGNVLETIQIPYKLDTMREIPVAEQEEVVKAYFANSATK